MPRAGRAARAAGVPVGRDTAGLDRVDDDRLEVRRDTQVLQPAEQAGLELGVDQRAQDRHPGYGADLAAGVGRGGRHARHGARAPRTGPPT